jgi:hypothetical protein
MRTTVTLDKDVAAAVERMRREQGMGLSESINELARRGLALEQQGPRRPFRQKTYPLGIRIDVTNVERALELLEGPLHG